MNLPLEQLTTATTTVRRAQRRQRAQARLAWYLHRKGFRILTARQLVRLYHTLNQHHSRDSQLLRSLLAAFTATMTSKQPSWRCAACHVVMKGTFPRCWKCGQEWGQCSDPSFTPPDRRHQQAYNQHQVQPPWDGQQWNDSNAGSWSPRTRTRRSSNRGRKKGKGNGTWQSGDHTNHPKGQGKGGEHYAPAQTPLPPFMPYPAGMPQYPQQMMPPPLPPPMIDKGAGKAMNPPMMMPSMPTAPSGAMTSNTTAMPWGPQAQMMAFPTAPLPTSATSSLEPTSGYRSDGPAQQKLNRLLKEMKKEEDNLSPHLQAIAHEMQKQGEKNNIKNLSSAVKALGDAKQDLLEAENARAQLLTQWRSFLQQSVVKWREFTANFQASESAHQQGVQAARLEVRKAQRAFDQASKKEQTGKEDTVEVSDEEDAEVTDDIMEDPHNESVQRIHQGMTSIVTSLEELSTSADQLEQRVKRPRTSATEGETAASQAAQPPFGKAGAV